MCTVASEILEPKEVAQMLKISVRTVTRLAEKNQLAGFKVGDMWRFRREAIEEYIRQQEAKQQGGKSE